MAQWLIPGEFNHAFCREITMGFRGFPKPWGACLVYCCAPLWCLDWFIASRRAQSEVIFTNMSTYLAINKCQPTSTFFATKIHYNPHVLPCSLSLRCQLPSAAGGQLLQPRDVAGALPPVPLLRHPVPQGDAKNRGALRLHQVQHLLRTYGLHAILSIYNGYI